MGSLLSPHAAGSLATIEPICRDTLATDMAGT